MPFDTCRVPRRLLGLVKNSTQPTGYDLAMALTVASRVVLISLLAAMVAACGLFAVSRDDLIGDFQIDYGYGVETLRLTNDGKYTQQVRLADENTWTTHAGTWELKDGDPPEVQLHDALLVDDGSGKPRAGWQQPVNGVRSLPVKKRFWTVSLVVDEGHGLTMTKLAPPPVSDQKPNIIRLPPRNDVEVK